MDRMVSLPSAQLQSSQPAQLPSLLMSGRKLLICLAPAFQRALVFWGLTSTPGTGSRVTFDSWLMGLFRRPGLGPFHGLSAPFPSVLLTYVIEMLT